MQRPDRWLATVGFELYNAAHIDASMAKKQSFFSRLGIAPFLDDLSDYKLVREAGSLSLQYTGRVFQMIFLLLGRADSAQCLET